MQITPSKEDSMTINRIRLSVQKALDNDRGRSDAERIANMEVFEAEKRRLLAAGNGPQRKDAKDYLDLLAALRGRTAKAQS